MVRSEEHGPIVIGAGGVRRLADDTISGEDPLAAFDDTAAEHLRRHDRFPHCPDILVNSMYDPDMNEVAPFEEFMGSHGGARRTADAPVRRRAGRVGRAQAADRGGRSDARGVAELACEANGTRRRSRMTGITLFSTPAQIRTTPSDALRSSGSSDRQD